MAEKKAEKLTKVRLKLRRRHPAKHVKIQGHRIEMRYQEFEMNEAALKELEGKGAQHWVISDKQEAAEKKAKEKEDEKKEDEK